MNPLSNPSNEILDELAEADLYAVAVHEMGHWHLAFALGIPATVVIKVTDDGKISGGLCISEFKAHDFESACFGWAGIMAEHMFGAVYRNRPQQLLFPLNEDYLPKWHHEAAYFLNVPGMFSDSDRHHIIKHRDTLETCKHTFRILARKADEIKADARLLANRYRPDIASKKFAATRADLSINQCLASGGKMSTSDRAKHLEQYLASLPANDSDLARLEPMLACLRRGEEPPVESVVG